MMNKSKSIFYILAPLHVAFLILFEAKSISAQEVDDQSDFDYLRTSGRGPTKWGEIRKEWAACNNGTMQSPIDMCNERVMIISKPEKRNYKVGNATLKNRGHDIQIAWSGDAGSTFINRTQYHLRFAHWHSPSEHTINGRRYDMELHMVHVSTDPCVRNKIAVIGMFYRIGKADEFLSKIMTILSSMATDKNVREIRGMIIDPQDIKIPSERFYRYMGSLTVPPCTEGVIWTINKKVTTVSRRQVRLLRDAVHDYAEVNARPLQAHNRRDIYLYGPEDTRD